MEQRLKKLIANGHESKIANFFDTLEKKIELPEDLVAKLAEVKNNPMDEPKIAKLKKDNANLSAVALEVLTKKEILDLEMEIVVDFARAVVEKATGFRDEDGNLKTTPNIDNAAMPNIFQAEDYNTLQKDMLKLRQDMLEDMKAAKDTKSIVKKIEKKTKELQGFIIEITGIDAELTEWEEQLLLQVVLEHINNGYASSGVGKH